MSRLAFWESSTYPSLRQVRTNDHALFLTFDDGPNSETTPLVLEVLKKHEVTATFFIIATRAQTLPELVTKIKAEGHAIGNHSLDHTYWAFFSGQAKMNTWIKESAAKLQTMGIHAIGFRPPAGVRTPQLYNALETHKIPLIMWQHRFYDTRFQWTPRRALNSLAQTRGGDIVLLHDSQRPDRIAGFLETLDIYITQAKARGFIVRAMTDADCHYPKQ